MEKRRKGRPPQDPSAAREKILDAATALLLQSGFDRFSIDAVARQGGVAKKTVYALIGSREDLVGQIVAHWTDTLDASDYPLPEVAHDGARSSALHALLRDISYIALSPQAIALFRLIASDKEARQRLAKVYNTNGIEKACRSLKSLLLRYQDAGLMKAFERDVIARAMLSVLIAEPLRRAAIGIDDPLVQSKKQRDHDIARCISVFEPILF